MGCLSSCTDWPPVEFDSQFSHALFVLTPPVLLAIDLLYGGIYCFMCQDYIYDKDMEQIAKEEQRKAWKMQGTRHLPHPPVVYTFCES